MLKIFNELAPFFEDCYQRINVRKYAKLMKISPPTASKALQNFEQASLLKKEVECGNFFYYANKESPIFIHLSRIYWLQMLIPLINHLGERLTNPTIVLFGSLSKAENKHNSDVDIAVKATRKELDLKKFEKKLRREIQVHWFKLEQVELNKNIANGFILKGRL